MSVKTSQKLSSLQLMQQRRHLIYSVSIFLLILFLAYGLVLTSDYREFEKQFSSDVKKIHTRFDYYIKQNESVLEGFSAFIAGLGNVNDVMLNRYAKQIKARFPHISMLEIAKEVKRSDLNSLIQKQRNKGYTDFDVREFDYFGDGGWKKLSHRDKYLPLIYLYPLSEESRKILGLDLNSHGHLASTFRNAIKEGGSQTSLPFTLIGGDKAFVMFKAVEATNDRHKPLFMTLIVLTVKDFLLTTDEMDSSLGILVYHNSKPRNDNSGHFFLKDIKAGQLLPKLTFETILAPDKSGFVLHINKQFQFKDISWVLLFIILNMFVTVFFITTGISSKNKLIQEKLLKASQQKHKMVAVSNLTGGIAHEFNNNLSVIRGFLNLLSDKVENDSESKAWISYAEKATEKSIELMYKLLTYSRYKGIRERVSNLVINEYIVKIKKELSQLLNKNINLEYDLTDNLSSILFGEDDLKEILFELVVNANDAIEENGLITISTKKVYLNGSEEIEIDHDVDIVPGNYIHLAVSDTGSGISDDIKLYVFDPFFTTKAFGESSGMGLASVYGLVKLNNGYINFSPNGEKGIVFNIYIPVLG